MLHLKTAFTMSFSDKICFAPLLPKDLTCLQAAQIWSISFSRLVHRAARNAAMLPGVGSTALPGAPEEQQVV